MAGCGTQLNDVNLGTMSCPNLMNAPWLPIWGGREDIRERK
jgi:hypothetical protein